MYYLNSKDGPLVNLTSRYPHSCIAPLLLGFDQYNTVKVVLNIFKANHKMIYIFHLDLWKHALEKANHHVGSMIILGKNRGHVKRMAVTSYKLLQPSTRVTRHMRKSHLELLAQSSLQMTPAAI